MGAGEGVGSGKRKEREQGRQERNNGDEEWSRKRPRKIMAATTITTSTKRIRKHRSGPTTCPSHPPCPPPRGAAARGARRTRRRQTGSWSCASTLRSRRRIGRRVQRCCGVEFLALRRRLEQPSGRRRRCCYETFRKSRLVSYDREATTTTTCGPGRRCVGVTRRRAMRASSGHGELSVGGSRACRRRRGSRRKEHRRQDRRKARPGSSRRTTITFRLHMHNRPWNCRHQTQAHHRMSPLPFSLRIAKDY
ncbi:hypothetical protein B0H14DRAFT_1514467 [Mycena olivaceomarginata]|nr:hypothetical protein B0H14DRAFT_1514467 [Mycena olivaceomarginata]